MEIVDRKCSLTIRVDRPEPDAAGRVKAGTIPVTLDCQTCAIYERIRAPLGFTSNFASLDPASMAKQIDDVQFLWERELADSDSESFRYLEETKGRLLVTRCQRYRKLIK